MLKLIPFFLMSLTLTSASVDPLSLQPATRRVLIAIEKAHNSNLLQIWSTRQLYFKLPSYMKKRLKSIVTYQDQVLTEDFDLQTQMEKHVDIAKMLLPKEIQPVKDKSAPEHNALIILRKTISHSLKALVNKASSHEKKRVNIIWFLKTCFQALENNLTSQIETLFYVLNVLEGDIEKNPHIEALIARVKTHENAPAKT